MSHGSGEPVSGSIPTRPGISLFAAGSRRHTRLDSRVAGAYGSVRRFALTN